MASSGEHLLYGLATYHKLVTTVKSFIRAERLHHWDLHVTTVSEMLPTFATANMNGMLYRLMRACKSSGGLTGGRLRNKNTAH